MSVAERREAFKRIECSGREDWLEKRMSHLQASEASLILNQSPWGDRCTLYDEKVSGIHKDISDKPYVIYGKNMEAPIRTAFLLDNPYFSCHYDEFGILVSNARPWQGCTLDGELTVTGDNNPWDLPVGARGVLEIKTGSFRVFRDLAEWEEGIPQHYYCQVIHQLSVTGYDFAIVVGRLKRDPYRSDDYGFPEIRTYHRFIDARRINVKEDIKALNAEELKFWQSLEKKKRPAKVLSFSK